MLTLYIGAIALIALNFLPRRRDFLETCETLTRRMPIAEHEQICDLLEKRPATSDGVFWQRTNGLSGQLKRMYVSYIYMRLVQAHRLEGRVDRGIAAEIWNKFCLQFWFSVLALPEAALCSLFHGVPRIAARASLRFFHEMVIGAYVLCVTAGDAPECIRNLNELL